MHLDVNDLRNFYYRTPLGRVAQRAIRDQLIRLWPPRAGETVLGYGFAVPLMRPYLEIARRVVGLMPGPQGVMAWPPGMPNVAVLCSEADWPIGDGMVDRLILMHGIETSADPASVMAEAYRVLAPGGVAMFVVPNRAGLWARRDATPFGYGRPYSGVQLEAHLRSHGFAPERSLTVLHAPPSRAPFWLRAAGFFEKAGRSLPWLSGGVLMVEATKQVIAPMRGGLGAAITRSSPLRQGLAQPVPSPRADGA